MTNWSFQEWLIEWPVWALGVKISPRYGWDLDEAIVYFGPLRLVYLKTSGGTE